jgi:hypothetical protein
MNNIYSILAIKLRVSKQKLFSYNKNEKGDVKVGKIYLINIILKKV